MSKIGKWTAMVKIEGKTPQIIVDGTFPTNGEKPRFHLVKNDPQGTISTELILTLVFGRLAKPGSTGSASVHYTEAIGSTEEYTTVLVVDDDFRTIANIKVEVAATKKQKRNQSRNQQKEKGSLRMVEE